MGLGSTWDTISKEAATMIRNKLRIVQELLACSYNTTPTTTTTTTKTTAAAAATATTTITKQQHNDNNNNNNNNSNNNNNNSSSKGLQTMPSRTRRVPAKESL
jgi:hypothetical protein